MDKRESLGILYIISSLVFLLSGIACLVLYLSYGRIMPQTCTVEDRTMIDSAVYIKICLNNTDTCTTVLMDGVIYIDKGYYVNETVRCYNYEKKPDEVRLLEIPVYSLPFTLVCISGCLTFMSMCYLIVPCLSQKRYRYMGYKDIEMT